MLVLHAQWADATGLTAWAEHADAAEPPRRAGRRPAAMPHPFAASSAALRLALGLPERHETPVVLSLPTAAGRPVASPELPEDVPEEAPVDLTPPEVTMAQWRVPALQLDADDAIGLLGRDLPSEITPGATVRVWAELARLARDLVDRGRVLPSIDPTGPRAVWRPVLTGADLSWAAALALALPPAGFGPPPGQKTPASHPVAAALDALTDAVVRARLGAAGAAGRGRTLRAVAATPADQWRAALTGSERTLPMTAAQADMLAVALGSWHVDALGGPVRARFRLLEPGTAGGATEPATTAAPDGWRLEFGLQATTEASLAVDAHQVWHLPEAVEALSRHIDHPREALVAELGRAHRLYPQLEPALRTAHPTHLDLDTTGAHDFLTGAASSLSDAGFGVLLPEWWGRPAARLGARVSAATPAQPGAVEGRPRFGQDALVQFQWQLAIGDEVLTEAELQALADLRQPLVRLRGQWVTLDAKRLRNGLAMLAGADSTTGTTFADLLRMVALDEGPGGLPVVGIDAEGWVGDLLSGAAEARVTPVATPDDFGGTLRPYQERGLAWLTFLQNLGLGAVLADDMGLGKTVQLLALFGADPPGGAPTLLVCPMSLIGNWQREAARFTPRLRVHVHHGRERARGKAFDEAVAGSDLVLTTYALAARDAAALGAIEWRRVVLDEAQAVKNAATKAASAVRNLPSQHRIAVTGTPVENRLADLWSIMQFANPGLLGSAPDFKSRFASPIENSGDAETARRLRTVTQPFILRRLKTDRSIITDLPDKIEMEVVCTLTREQGVLYQSIVDDMIAKIEQTEGIERRGLILATMTKLKQVCNHPAQLLRDGSSLAGRSGKLARLEEILDEVLAGNERALLFTQYAEFGGMLRSHLSSRFGREVAYLHGGVAKPARDDMVERFQRADASSPSLFVLSLKAGGTGLTLTAANHVVHVDRWWNPAVEDQATDRAYRIGQTRGVQVRKLVCAGTLEEKISAMIRDKKGLAASIVGTGEGWLTELSTSHLRELFTLDAGSVVE